MNVIALVPAHNEEEQISATLDSLLAQTMPLDKILVILDNCTDSTEQIVAGCSTRFPVVEYMSSVDNPHKKAGALNQALPLCEGFKYILDTDADAILSPHFTERAVQEMEQDPRIGALSAREGIKEYPDATLKQRLVYRVVRYQRYLWDTFRMENPADAVVMVGPGAMLRTEAIMAIDGWRNDSITEDNALSLDLREAGWRTVLGRKCYVWSDSPLDLRPLWQQRVRWGRGTEDYATRGWSRATWKGKALAWYQWALLAWVLAIVPFEIINEAYFTPMWLLPLAVIYADRLWRLRFFPTFKALDLLLASPLCELAMFATWQSAIIAGAIQRWRKIERKW